MDEKTNQLTHGQKCLSVLIVICLFVYTITNTGLVIAAFVKLKTYSPLLSELADNWRIGSIINIQVAVDCPVGYEPAAPNEYWPGIKSGCWCGSVTNDILYANNITCNPFCDHVCNIEEGRLGCKTVDGWQPQRINFWGEMGQNVQICVERTTETWATIAPIGQGYCPSGYLRCGTIQEYIFCTKQQKCPIAKVEIVSMTAAQQTTCLADPDTCVVLDTSATNPRMILYSRSGTYDALPLAEFRVNENGMCLLKKQDEVTPGRLPFPLLIEKYTSCYDEGSYKWTVSDTITESTMFSLNSLGVYISNLDQFPSSGMSGYYPTGTDGDSFQWKLFTRSYVPWKISCRDQMEKLISKILNSSLMKTAQLVLMIVALVGSGFQGIILTFIKIQYIRGANLPWVLANGKIPRRKILLFEQITTCFFKILQIPFQIWTVVLVGTTKDLYFDLSDQSCTDADINQTLWNYAFNLKESYQMTCASLGITAGFLVIQSLLMCFYTNTNKPPKKRVQPPQLPPKKALKASEQWKHKKELNVVNSSISTVTPFTPARVRYHDGYNIHSIGTPVDLTGFRPERMARRYPSPQVEPVDQFFYDEMYPRQYNDDFEDYRIYPRQYPHDD